MSTDPNPRDSVRQSPARDIPVRRLQPLPTERIGPRFAGEDPVVSNMIAVLSGMFPSGESLFVRSVRDQREHLCDPELREHVNRFVGQESMHGGLHRQLNGRLEELGFRVRLFAGLIRLPRCPFLSAGVLRHVRAYNRRDFHPDAFDATELRELWRVQLFGQNGFLSEKLNHAS